MARQPYTGGVSHRLARPRVTYLLPYSLTFMLLAAIVGGMLWGISTSGSIGETAAGALFAGVVLVSLPLSLFKMVRTHAGNYYIIESAFGKFVGLIGERRGGVSLLLFYYSVDHNALPLPATVTAHVKNFRIPVRGGYYQYQADLHLSVAFYPKLVRLNELAELPLYHEPSLEQVLRQRAIQRVEQSFGRALGELVFDYTDVHGLANALDQLSQRGFRERLDDAVRAGFPAPETVTRGKSPALGLLYKSHDLRNHAQENVQDLISRGALPARAPSLALEMGLFADELSLLAGALHAYNSSRGFVPGAASADDLIVPGIPGAPPVAQNIPDPQYGGPLPPPEPRAVAPTPPERAPSPAQDDPPSAAPPDTPLYQPDLSGYRPQTLYDPPLLVRVFEDGIEDVVTVFIQAYGLMSSPFRHSRPPRARQPDRRVVPPDYTSESLAHPLGNRPDAPQAAPPAEVPVIDDIVLPPSMARHLSPRGVIDFTRLIYTDADIEPVEPAPIPAQSAALPDTQEHRATSERLGVDMTGLIGRDTPDDPALPDSDEEKTP